jgi:hypothetical protein
MKTEIIQEFVLSINKRIVMTVKSTVHSEEFPNDILSLHAARSQTSNNAITSM